MNIYSIILLNCNEASALPWKGNGELTQELKKQYIKEVEIDYLVWNKASI